jgi:hypothetical protein
MADNSPMTIITVPVVDMTNPVELQAWLDKNSSASISRIMLSGSIFYIFYQ